MKIMIASDTHGSELFIEKMIERFYAEGAEKLLLLGDLLYHGPRNDLPTKYNPKDAIAMLNGIKDKIICVQGNCDAEVDQCVLDFPIIPGYTLFSIDGIEMYLTHGNRYNIGNPMPILDGSVMLYGHTHVPDATLHKGVWYLNPGSVSIPKGGSINSYMIYQDRKFEWKNMHGATYKTLEI